MTDLSVIEALLTAAAIEPGPLPQRVRELIARDAAHARLARERAVERDQARADGVRLYVLIRDYLDCSECHGNGIHWSDIDGEAEPEVCDARIALEEFDASLFKEAAHAR